MSYITRNLRQTITYWSPSTPDGFGGKSFGSPTTLNGRWEDKVVEFVDPEGRESVSQAIVYTDTDVSLGGFLYNGTSTASDPNSVDGAREIRNFSKTPNLKANQFERKVIL